MKFISLDSAGKLSKNQSVPITVCIPVYNGAGFIQRCLESVAEQTFKNFRVFVVDNCSTDSTKIICSAFNDDRFFFIRNAENVGSIRNHNRCLDIAGPNYAKLLSADDALMPDILELQYTLMQSDLRVGIASCNLIEADSELHPINVVHFLSGKRNGKEAITACTRKMQNLIGGPSATLLRMNTVAANRFRTDLYWLADLEFHCRLLKNSDYCSTDTSGFLYRRHAGSDSVVGCSPRIRVSDEMKFLTEFNGPISAYMRVYLRYLKQAYR